MPVFTVFACLAAAIAAPLPGTAAEIDTLQAKYWIFFDGKPESAAKYAELAESGFISPRALERRSRRGAVHGISGTDVPVNPDYVDQLAGMGIEVIAISRWLNAVSAYLTSQRLENIGSLPFVSEVRSVRVFAREIEPASRADPVFKSADMFGNSRDQLALMNAILPINRGYSGAGIRLGFLDTLFDFDHPAFERLVSEERLIAVEDFTGLDQTSMHGLWVTSAAVGYLPGALIGPAHGAEVLAATTEYAPAEIRLEEDFFVAGMEWLERMGADVVNASLGYTTFDPGEGDYSYDDMDGQTAIPTLAANMAARLGVVVVTSAGNSGNCSPEDPECWYFIGSPADSDSVITVGAVWPDSTRAPFSSWGPTSDGRTKPDVSAQGVAVYAAHHAQPFAAFNGTSFSSPLVAGVVCQMLEANPNLTPAEVRGILRQTASQSDNPDNSLGWGIINADMAVITASAVEIPETFAASSPYPNPFSSRVTFEIEASKVTPAITLEIYDILGRRVAAPFHGVPRVGMNQVSFNGTDLAPGVYLYRWFGDGISASGKMIRLR